MIEETRNTDGSSEPATGSPTSTGIVEPTPVTKAESDAPAPAPESPGAEAPAPATESAVDEAADPGAVTDAVERSSSEATAGAPEANAAPPAADTPSSDTKQDDAKAPAAEVAAKPAKDKPKRKRTPVRDRALARAFRTGRPVDGRIQAVIKGGYEVRIGKSRGFCPHSQIDLQRVDDPESLVGETRPFKVMQFRRGGDDVVVSHRALREDERAEEAKAVRAALVEGAVVEGKVSGLADFGAFVDLGAGVMGLVHISELSHSRVTKVDAVVKSGDRLAVKILKLAETGKISLSARRAMEDPWAKVGERFPAGSVVSGAVTRLADFGAFVELAPGVEALAPGREFPPKAGGWREGLTVGEPQDWLILSTDARRRRISVTPAPENPEAADLNVEPGAQLAGKVQKVERFGVFVWLAPGKVGLMPNALSGTRKGTDLTRQFPVGQSIDVEVVEIESQGKIRLARQGHAPDKREPRAERRTGRRAEPGRDQAESAPEEPPAAFGTSLGDLLRAAIDRKSS